MTTEVTTYPASHAERRLWFMDKLSSNSSAFNIAVAYRVKSGNLDEAALERALRIMVRSNPSLRTFFTGDGQAVLKTISTVVASPLRDYSCIGEPDIATIERLTQDAYLQFDLSRAPLFRVNVYKVNTEQVYIVFAAHQVVCDMRSLSILLQQLNGLYDVEAHHQQALHSIEEHGADRINFAAQERENLDDTRTGEDRVFWQRQLDADAPTPELPIDRPRPLVQTFAGAAVATDVGDALAANLWALALSERVTLHSVLLAAIQTLLYRYTGDSEVRVGCPSSLRDDRQMENVVGNLTQPHCPPDTP